MSFMQTSRSQLNNSKFKQLYSFPKANRFTTQVFVSKAPYYDNKVTALGKRSTSFGFGDKFTLQNKNPFPPPNNYSKVGLFEQGLQKRKGYSFNHDHKKGLINEDELAKIPGPGKYNYKTDREDFKRVSYSMRAKYEDPMSRHQNPLGPGQYATVSELNKSGTYFVTKHHNSGCSKIGNSKRFQQIKTISPGPGKYQDQKVTGFNNSGTYYYSSFRTSKGTPFGHSPRKHIADPSFTPGPGSYNRFSDFPFNKK